MISGFLASLDDQAKAALTQRVDIQEWDGIPPVEKMGLGQPRWCRVDDVVALVADLKGSTNFNYGRQTKTVARFYEAYMGPLVRVANHWSPRFIAIQGDGLFALFDGKLCYERAFVTGLTMLAFVHEHLLPALEGRLADVPPTGLKVGMASGPIWVKRVGIGDQSEPIWAGRPVNWASKCAQAASAGEVVVTPQVKTHFAANPMIMQACRCRGVLGLVGRYVDRYAEIVPRLDLWQSKSVRRLPSEHRECSSRCQLWCPDCGDVVASEILSGQVKWPAET
jgi:class 3 adenylate cyclase